MATYDHLATKADLYRAVMQLGIFLAGVTTAIVSAAVAFLKLTA